MKTRKLTSEEWSDVADLCEQGAVQAEQSEPNDKNHFGSHKARAIKKAAEIMRKAAMVATGHSMRARLRELKQKPA